ncbi:terminase large subunit [Larkinella sp. C7]|uniref:terminase large subunit n=1 Tax=Larkinella sp. C7 TaxID=2576607 RepID=UPI001111307B|nr:terminase large subunit [Larkinella sp. C7]
MQPLTIEQVQIEQIRREQARRSYVWFVPYLKPDYSMQPFHAVMADRLQRFADGHIKKLMITTPPQHGKSELSTRNLPPYLFGKNPNRKIAVLSYAATKAKKFNREIQLRMDSDRYKHLFPSVRLASHKDPASTRTTDEFDIVGNGGVLKSVGRQGPLTGDPVDIVIFDDLLKDLQEAKSLTIRERTWDWIESVVEARLDNDGQMLYVTTRWDEDDPAGRFLDRDGYWSDVNPDGWILLNFAALRTADILPYDDRPLGAALWPEKHSRERMEKKRTDSPITFNALYQGDPKPSPEAMVFPDWAEIDEMPSCDVYFHGLDFGFSNHPSALIKIGKIGNRLYLDEVFYKTGLTNQDLLQYYHAAGLPPGRETICDKAEPKSLEELRRGTYDAHGKKLPGINATGCDKGPGSVNAGISKLKEYRVFYTRRSRNLAREVKNYQWIMAGGKATNDPVDDYNHAMDAVRGAVFTKYNKPKKGAGKFRSIQLSSPKTI